MIIFFIINIILLISNIIVGVLVDRKSDRVDEREKKLDKREKNIVKTFKNIKKAYEDIIAEIQPLQDEQKNCKRGEWCSTCSFGKKVIIPFYSIDDVTMVEVCTKGICKEYAQIQGEN